MGPETAVSEGSAMVLAGVDVEGDVHGDVGGDAVARNGAPGAEAAMPGVAVESWRDAGTRDLASSFLGAAVLGGRLSRTAPEHYRSGARCVRLVEPVRLCAGASAASVQALILVRELTGLGAAVAWTAECDDGCVTSRRFAHLFPPAAVHGADPAALDEWRGRYLPCMCVWRRGPGFVEVRDRRPGTLEIFTIDDPDTLVALDAAQDGVALGALPDAVREELRDADLLAEHDGLAWWTPIRIRRWPNPSMIL